MTSTPSRTLTCFPAAAVLALSHLLALIAPAALTAAVVLAVGAAVLGATQAPARSASLVVRSVLLAVGAFAFPVFLGGRVLLWIAVLACTALTVVGWITPRGGVADRLATAQVLATALAVALAAAAAQFFFPAAWAWVALGAVAVFLALAWAATAEAAAHRVTAPVACAVSLVLSEALVVLRYLPAHWVIGGAVLALAFAAAIEESRIPRTAFASLLIVTLLFGVL